MASERCERCGRTVCAWAFNKAAGRAEWMDEVEECRRAGTKAWQEALALAESVVEAARKLTGWYLRHDEVIGADAKNLEAALSAYDAHRSKR